MYTSDRWRNNSWVLSYYGGIQQCKRKRTVVYIWRVHLGSTNFTEIENFLLKVKIKINWNSTVGLMNRNGNGAGQGWRMESSFPPRIVLSCSIPTLSRLMGKTFSPHPHPLGPHKAPPHKTLLFVNLPYN